MGSKVYAKILARMQERSEKLLWEAQGGFRPGRGCMNQIFSVRMIKEKFLAVNQKVFCVFMDLEIMGDTIPVQYKRTLAAGRKVSLQRSLILRANRSWHVALV